MKNRKIKQLKKILTGFGVGVAGTSAVIPVIACGGNEITTTGSAIDDAIDRVKEELALDNVEINNGIVNNLPDTPSGTHWEYRVGDDGNFSPAPPTQINPNKNVVIRLVSDSNTVQLPENVEAKVTVNDEFDDDSNAQVVEVSKDTKTELDKVVINSDGTVNNVASFLNAHLEYSIDDGISFSKRLPADFNGGEKVVVKLVANNKYELSTDDNLLTQTTVIVNKEITISDKFLSEFDSAYALQYENDINLHVPPAPEHTHWESAVQSGSYSETLLLSSVQPENIVKLRLVADENYFLNQKVEKVNVEVIQSAVMDVEALNKAFEKVRVDNFSNIINLPNAPDKTFWTFAVNNEVNYQNVDKMFGTNLVNGDKIKFRLASTQGITLTDEELTEHVVTVTKTVFAQDFADQLASAPSELSTDVDVLPTAPENTHWEYEFSDDTTATSLSDDLTTGEKVAVKLVANQNYHLNEPVERNDFIFVKFVRPSDAVRNALDQVAVRANDEAIMGLPTAPDNSHWEYQIINGSFVSNVYLDFSPVQYFDSNSLKPGNQIKITLVPDNSNYQLAGEPVEKLVTVDKAIIDIESPMENGLSMKEQLQQDLDKFFNFNPANESINWVPDYIPEGTYWEYSIDDGEFTRESPRIGPEYYSGEKALNLKLRLTTNNDYDDSIYELNGSFEWSIQALGIVDTTNYNEWIERDDAYIPEAPEHSLLMYSTEPWAVTDPNRPYHPYVVWIEPDEGWILSREVIVGKD